MRTLLFLVLICCALTASAQSPPPATAKPFNPLAPMPAEQIARVKERMRLLRAEMTDEQVFVTLGLSDQYDYATGIGGGPHFLYHTSYTLPGSPSLSITRDFSVEGRKNGLLRVRFDGASWERIEKK